MKIGNNKLIQIHMELTLNFEFKKETPGTYVYSEIVPEDEEVSVPTLYIKKRAFTDTRPEKIQIVVKAGE